MINYIMAFEVKGVRNRKKERMRERKKDREGGRETKREWKRESSYPTFHSPLCSSWIHFFYSFTRDTKSGPRLCPRIDFHYYRTVQCTYISCRSKQCLIKMEIDEPFCIQNIFSQYLVVDYSYLLIGYQSIIHNIFHSHKFFLLKKIKFAESKFKVFNKKVSKFSKKVHCLHLINWNMKISVNVTFFPSKIRIFFNLNKKFHKKLEKSVFDFFFFFLRFFFSYSFVVIDHFSSKRIYLYFYKQITNMTAMCSRTTITRHMHCHSLKESNI